MERREMDPSSRGFAATGASLMLSHRPGSAANIAIPVRKRCTRIFR
jgi:hypothetical protein